MASTAKSPRGFLPLITENRSLVSPSPSIRAATQQDQVLNWVDATKRRIQEKVIANPGDEAAVTLSILKQELVAVFIEVLQKKDRNSWKFLSDVLFHMKAYQSYLSVASQEICHYVERIFTYMDVHEDEFLDLDIAESLQLIFPKAVDHVKSQRSLKKSSQGYSPLAIPKSKPSDMKRKLPSLTLPDGTNPYRRKVTMEFQRPIQKFLTFGDLDSTVADVALQTATREAIWNACLGTTALALSVQLPQGPHDHIVPPVASDAMVTVAESVAESSDDEVLETLHEEKMEETSAPMNGREAVEHFAKCHHLGKIQFMYFNLAPSRHFRPYDVVEVSKDKVKKEHYIFSTFGVLHVIGGDHSEVMSLAEWQRDAVLWSAASKIPFFKSYLIRKAFHRWRANVHFQRFAKVRHQVAVRLLSSMPCYGAALQQVLRLCQELMLVRFLPLTNSKCYRLPDFELDVSSAQKDAAEILEKFFRFQKLITNTVREELLKRINQCAAQPQNSLLVSKESHYLHSVKKQQRKDILKQLKHEASFFGTFVILLKKILLSYLIKLAQDNVSLFVGSFVSLSGSREAYFTTALTFSSNADVLCLSPPTEMYSDVILKMFRDIPSFLIWSATSLEEDEAVDRRSGDNQESPPTQRFRSGTVLTEGEGDFNRALSTYSEGWPKDSMLDSSTAGFKQSGVEPYFETLSESNVAEKLANDNQFQSALSEVMQLNKAASDDLSDFLQKNTWLNEIYLFTNKWTAKESVLQWISAPAYVIEQKLNTVKQWRERIGNYESTYTTDNGLFIIDCTSVQETLLPKLGSIHQELCVFVNEQAVTLAEKFCNEMKICIQNMTEKKTSIGEFAEYARNVKMYQRNMSNYQQQGEYIKSLFEVMRMTYRHLTPEEERLEESVMAFWNQFLVLLQEAMEFVNLQTPLIIQSLDSLFKKLEDEAKEICTKATTGKFLDPDQNPTAVLIEMTKLREQFYSIHKQMHEASKWKELITGEPYDIKFLAVMAGQMDARQEVWKYFEVATHSLREWRATIFKKFNVKRAIEKVAEWMKAAEHMRQLLGEDDPVLVVWTSQLEDFKQHLPYLLKLSHPSLKVKHWQQIFLMAGHEYDPTYPYTVGDLMQLGLGSCGQMIDNVLSAAIAEEGVEQKLAAFHKLWIEREFKLAKHLPESLLRGGSDETLVKASLSRHSSGKMMQRKKLQSAKKLANVSRSLDISRNGLDILIEVDQLKYLLEDSRLTLQTMSSSPFLVMQSEEIHRWLTSLAEIDELLDLWHNCQTQWLYLLKIFDNEDLCQKLKTEATSFKTVHSSFTDFMSAVVADPLVLSILSKPRVDRHFRFHQGHRLRTLLSSLIQQMEEILSSLSFFLEDARNQFPRLYFLSDQELVQLLSISRNPVAFLPFVRRCFHGIKSGSFELPIGTTVRGSSSSSLTYILNGYSQLSSSDLVYVDKLELVRLVGPQGEEMKLCKNVKPQSQATKWLADLEQTMRSSIQMAMETCVQCKLDDEAKQPIQLLECLGKFMENESTAQDATSATASSVVSAAAAASSSHWMLTFPEQCVLTTEAIIWQRNVQHALSKYDKDLLKSHCSNVSNQLSQYSKVLQEINSLPADSRGRKLIRSLLGNLVCQALHHRDVMNKLLERSDLSINSFEWIRTLKYEMDVHSILNAKSMTPDDSDKKNHQATPSQHDVASYGKMETPSRRSLPQFDQDRTMISTGYRFGQCLISQMGKTFAYDCEFVGATQRLVVTPMTERAHLALSMAVGTFQCGMLSGSNGTGKSETIQDLAKAFGRHLVVIDCNNELPMTVINRYMTGLIQSGSWGLFDNCERIPEGMLSVLAQHLDFLTQTLHVLANTVGNQYGIRGLAGTDRKPSEKVTRRNSLTTLHSLPVSTEDEELRSVKKIGLGRQTTVPHGYNEEGLLTYFEDPWVKERERRNSFGRDSGMKESADHGRSNKSVDQSHLLYEHVTLHRRPKMNFENLQQHTSTYKPQYIGSLLFNGKLCHANASYGCFMTVNMTEFTFAKIPENLKVSMRPCAMMCPDYKVITEVSLYCSGFEQYQTLAAKIVTFIDLITRQLPSRAQYDFGLRTILSVVRLAAAWLGIQVRRRKCESLRQLSSAASQKPRSRSPSSSGSQPYDGKLNSGDLQDREEDNKSVVSGSSTNSSLTSFLAASDCLAGEEELIIQALTSILLSRMATPDDSLRFKNLMRDVFPSSVRPKTSREPYSATVVSAIFEQLRCSNLSPSNCFISKMLQLYSSLQLKQGVILTGPSGSGKTTAYQVLAQVLNQIHDELLQNPRKDEVLCLEKQNLVGIHSDGLMKSHLSSNNGVISDGIHVVQDTERIVCPKVDVDVLFPNVFTHEELYGRYDGSRWQTGLLTTILKKAYSQADLASRWKPARAVSGTSDRSTSKWIILDGQLNADWVDTLTGLLDDGGQTLLPNGETLCLHESTRMLFELSDFSNASPSTISRCAVVNFPDETIGWRSLIDTWSKSASERWIISSSSLQVLNSLVSAIFPASITFTQKELLASGLVHGFSSPSKGCGIVPGFAQVSAYLNIFSALMDQHFSREKFEEKEKLQQQHQQQARGSAVDDIGYSARTARAMSSTAHAENAIPNYLVTIKRLFVFAYIWGFGARLRERSVKKFDKFAREILHKTLSSLVLPEEDDSTLFDFGIDCKLGRFFPWGEISQEKTRHASQNIFISVPELERYSFWIELFLNSHKPLLISGDVGIGKSSLIENALAGRQSSSTVVMTENLSSSRFQHQIMPSLPDQMNNDRIQSKSAANRRHIVFIDDLSLAGHRNGVAGSLELLRQMLTQKALPDRKRQMLISVADVDFLAAATNPGCLGAGTSSLDARLLRLFTTFNMFSPSEKALHSIYGRLIQSWLDEFPLELFGNRRKLSEVMVTGAMEMYHQVKANVRPMPGHPYCIFTLHDLSRIFGGMMLLSPRSQRQAKSKVDSLAGDALPPVLRSLVRLWCHECSRVLGDRIVHPEDSKWFQLLLENTMSKVFCSAPRKSDQSSLVLQPDLLPSSDRNLVSSSSKRCSPAPPDADEETARWPSRATEVHSLQEEQVMVEEKTEDVHLPLKSIEQVVSHGQSLMDITFSKYILSSRRRSSLPPEEAKGYSECNLEQLMKALSGCPASLRHDLNLPQDMVFFAEAAQHIARLSRVLATPRGHALLIAEGFPTGRTTLVRLASHLAKCQFYELDHDMESDRDGSPVQTLLKECSHSVGVSGKPAVLFVHEGISDALMADVCAFMKYGTCPGLYEDNEISQIAGQMMPGQLKLMTKAKIVKAFEQFLQRVSKHLHVVICVQNEETLQETLHRFPQLMTCVCHVDVYEPWSHQTLTTIADNWLRDPQLKIPIPWDEQNKSEQICLVARAMAYIHQSTVLATSKQYLHQKLHHQFISPITYREFVHSFRLIAANLAIKELEGLKKFDAGLQKVRDASEELASQRRHLSDMEEAHRNMTTKVADLVSSINQLKSELSQAQQTCKEEEDMIVSLTSSIKNIQSSSLEKYGQVDPTYKAALDSLESLEQHYVEEVRSYRQPPEGVQLVMDAVCLLFNVPSGWENAKLMLIRDRFFEDLVYFDKNSISEEVFEKLGIYIRNPLFVCEEIAKSSVAAANVCQWVRAVYGYARVAQDMKPMLKELQESQSQLRASQANLGKKRLAVQHLKSALRQEIAAYKEATALAKELEKQMREMGKTVEDSEHLLESFAMHQRNWKNEVKEAKSRLRSAIANGLLTAACITYFGPLNHQTRSSLIQDWLERSEIGDFDPGLDLQKPEYLRALTMSSIHSQQTQGNDCGTSSQGDDALTIHEIERNLSLASDASLVRNKFHPRVPVIPSDVAANTDSAASASPGSVSIKSLLAVSEDFALHQVLSSAAETTCWEIEGLPLDPCSLDNALLMRGALLYSRHCWPLLVDPDGQAERWLHALLSSSNANRLNRDEADFIELLDENQKMDVSMATCDSATATSLTASENTESNKSAAVSEKQGDALSMPVLEVIERPKNNLWTISSEDPDLPDRLIAALLHGIVVLITKVERKFLPKYLHPILFRELMSDGNQHTSVEIDGKTVACHRNFRLFLSISVPLSFKGGELKEVKIGKMSIIDLTLSQEGIVNHLLREILSIERPEFEAQKRSMVKDFQQHKRELDSCQADVLERVLTMGGLMLLDKTMQGFVDESQSNIDRLQAILGDAKTLQELLERKRVPYFSVATNCAKLYEIISRMSVLHPAYHMSFAELLTLVSETVMARYRGKGNTGALEARAKELTDAATEAIYHQISSRMFEPHVYLFALLATFEKLRLSHQLTNNELALFVNGVDTSAVENNAVCENKPEWMSKKVWLDCAALESALSIFRSLRESFNKHSSEWQEYFKCPFDILNPWPGNWVRSASVFQKCLLWRICVPERLWEVCWPLVVHELGGATHRPHNYNIREIYKKSSSSVPTIFLLPSSPYTSFTQGGGLCFSHPTHELQQLAREMSAENRLRTIACGLPTQVVEIESALKECAQMGYWLVLQNLHLCPQLSPGIIEHLESVVDSERGQQMSPVTHQSSKQFTPKNESADLKEGGEVFHKDFRLWITVSADHISFIPGILMQSGQIVTCEATNNFQNRLLCTYASTQMLFSRANIKDVTANKIRSTTYQMALSLLHSLLLYRQNYTSLTTKKFGQFCNWTLADLALVIDSLHLVASNDCPDNTDIAEVVGIIYGNRCPLTCDTEWVYEAAYSLLTSVNNPKEKVRCAAGVTSVLPLLLLTEKNTFEHQLTSMIEPHPDTMGISADVQAEFLQSHSKRLLNDLVRVMGDPASLRIGFQKAYLSAETILLNIQVHLSKFPQIPPKNGSHLSPLDLFLQSELDAFQQLLDLISADIIQLLLIVRGQLAPSPSSHEAVINISQHRIPPKWQEASLFSPITDILQWIGVLERRLHLIIDYLPAKTRPVVFQIGAFNRPDRLLQVALLHSARQQFKSAHTSALDIQIIQDGSDVSKQPLTGIYVEGLILHNATWNKYKASIDEGGIASVGAKTSAGGQVKMPIIWLRQKDKNINNQRDQEEHSRYYYDCPIYASEKAMQQSYCGSLQLASSVKPPICLGRHIFLSCDYPK